MENQTFDLGDYFKRMDNIIRSIIQRPESDNITYDILDTNKSKTCKQNALREKHRLMKVGEIWQEAIGNYDGFSNLKVGHKTGLDILSDTKKIAIELKNRTNTDNASSKKSNLDKLAKFKMENPEYNCIYANINADTEKKTMEGVMKIIIHGEVAIEHRVGLPFLQYIFEGNTQIILEFIKNTIDKYT